MVTSNAQLPDLQDARGVVRTTVDGIRLVVIPVAYANEMGYRARIGAFLRFALRATQDLVAGIEDGSTLAALPDLIAGHRLAGAAANRDAICDALLAHGANPLLVAAFRARMPSQQASAA